MIDFVSNLDRINELADSSEGFVWRLQGEGNDATSLRPFDDDFIIVNMSVWDNLESLKNYVYKSAHTDILKRRAEWFEKVQEATMPAGASYGLEAMVVMWWIPQGHIPIVSEAKERLEHLRLHGSSEFAFSFQKAFPAPEV